MILPFFWRKHSAEVIQTPFIHTTWRCPLLVSMTVFFQPSIRAVFTPHTQASLHWHWTNDQVCNSSMESCVTFELTTLFVFTIKAMGPCCFLFCISWQIHDSIRRACVMIQILLVFLFHSLEEGIPLLTIWKWLAIKFLSNLSLKVNYIEFFFFNKQLL